MKLPNLQNEGRKVSESFMKFHELKLSILEVSEPYVTQPLAALQPPENANSSQVYIATHYFFAFFLVGRNTVQPYSLDYFETEEITDIPKAESRL